MARLISSTVIASGQICELSRRMSLNLPSGLLLTGCRLQAALEANDHLAVDTPVMTFSSKFDLMIEIIRNIFYGQGGHRRHLPEK